jgi:D-beta-D-heptose 7-phosphate kinase / D-beta-D-heptose 1-phosphate adenosyltransferase
VRRRPLVVVGDALLDRDLLGHATRLSPDAPVPVVSDVAETERPGGAGLAALLAAADGRDVVLVTAFGADPAGERLRQLLDSAGVTVLAGRLAGRTPEKIRVRAGNQWLLRLDRTDRPAPPELSVDAIIAVLARAGGVLAADYGRGLLALQPVRAELTRLAATVPVVWDPHPRGSRPVPGVRLATPNLAEAGGAIAEPGSEPGVGPGTVPAEGDRSVIVAARAARALLERWQVHGVAVTLGARGALLATPDEVPLVVPASAVPSRDTCGAGDRFAATVAGRLADGALPSEAVTAGVHAATGYVAGGGASRVGRPVRRAGRSSTVDDVVRRTRAASGTVVATGGCFDLLHAGHVSTLEAARRLGDCLVVCVNSDASVRRLKGRSRPLVPLRDRVRVLAALGCVDGIAVFDEDTPLAVLEQIRPDVWVKGGDYTSATLPETEVLARWGGEVVVVPYLAGRSTTGLAELAAMGGRRDG